jgi:hypothetical protein
MKFDKGKTKARYGADGPDSSTCGSGCQAQYRQGFSLFSSSDMYAPAHM